MTEAAIAPGDPRLSAYLQATRRDPAGWIWNALGERAWSKQAEILKALADHRLVTVRSSNAVGKSRAAALAVIWWMNAYPNSYCITTGASWQSIKRIVWPDIRKIVKNARVPDIAKMGRLLDKEWVIADRWAAFGVAMNTEETFAGFRTGEGVFVIVDEASALTEDIYNAIMGVCAGANCRILLIGNPLRPEGPFYKSHTAWPGWQRFHISAYDSPNVTGEANVPGLATREWIEERRREWGEGSPIYKARVLGDFPESSEDTVIPLDLVMTAVIRPKIGKQPIRVGVDVARFGDDDTVIVVVQGNHIKEIIRTSGKSTMETCGRVITVIHENKPESVYIDDIGVGGGVVDRLKELGYSVTGVNVANQAIDHRRYANVRAEMWFRIEQWLKDGGALPDDVRLIGDLTSARYGYTSAGQLKLEPKEDTKKRLGRSPDAGDALGLALIPATERYELW